MSLDNKKSINTSYGDSQPVQFADAVQDQQHDFMQDTRGVSASFPDNKFDAGWSGGDTDATFPGDLNDNKRDFSENSAGVPNVNRGEMTPMDMVLEGNKFPRQTGHDSVGEDIVLT